MNLLFIQNFLEHDYQKIAQKSEIIVAIWLVVGIACIIDLFFGIKRAYRMKISRTSTGFRKTIKKANEYGAFLLMALLIDFLLSVWIFTPFATIITSLFLVFIEARSVWESLEKNDQKQYKENVHDFVGLIKNLREEDKTKILDLLKDKTKPEEQTENNTN